MKSNQVVLREHVFSKLNCGALRLVPFVQLKKRFQLFLTQLQNFHLSPIILPFIQQNPFYLTINELVQHSFSPCITLCDAYSDHHYTQLVDPSRFHEENRSNFLVNFLGVRTNRSSRREVFLKKRCS